VIKLLDGEFVPWDLFSARVLAARRSYDDGQFWAQGCESSGGNYFCATKVRKSAAPIAVISLVDSFAILSARENADWEELVVFLQMQPWRQMQCGAEVAKRLSFPIEWTSMLVRFIAPKQELSNNNIAVANDPGEVYDILARCFSEMQNRNDWMADLALRWRRGTAKSWIIENACTASALALTETHAFLGALGTLPEARGKGLAGRLLTHIGEYYAGRAIWLSCREELRGFYESIGFEWEGEMITLNRGNHA